MNTKIIYIAANIIKVFGSLQALTKDKAIQVVLTIAHLNHDITDNRDENLRALCQRCHLRYDAKHHAQTRRQKKLKNQLKINF